MKRRLIAYFSRADENYYDGEIRNIEVGNTAIVAKKLKPIAGADLLEIKMKTPYSANYKECVAQAKEDLANNARPELVDLPADLNDVTVVYLGYPNYCGTIPMAVASFLESFDFTGKKIRPFCTQEGGGLGNSENDIMRLCPTAILETGCAIKGSEVDQCDELLQSWVNYFYGL